MKAFLSLVFILIYSFTFSQKVSPQLEKIRSLRIVNPDSCIILGKEYSKTKNPKKDFYEFAFLQNCIGTAYYVLGEVQTADSIYASGISFAKKANNDTLQIFIYSNRGAMHSGYGNFEKAKTSFNRGLKIAKKTKLNREIADVYNNIATLYSNYDIPDSAEYYFLEAIHYYNKEKERPSVAKLGIADIKANLGQLNFKQGKTNDAFKNLFSSLKIFEEFKAWDKAGITANAISELYFSRRDFTKATKYAKLSIEFDDLFPIERNRANAYFMLGKINHEKKEFDTALKYYNLTSEIYQKYNYYYDLPIVYNSLGALYEEKNENAKGIDQLNKSIKINKEIGDSISIAINCQNLARLYKKVGNLSLAKKNADRALQNISKEANFSLFVDTYGVAADIYAATGNFKEAYQLFTIYNAYKDSLNQENYLKAQEEVEAVYQTEKKELQLEKQKSENEKKSLELKHSEEQNNARSLQLKIAIAAGFILLILIGFVFRANIQRRKMNEVLSQKNEVIYKQKQEVELKQEELIIQNHIIEEKQKEILDSINYAKKIQQTLLADEALIKKHLTEHFIFFQPKDIVSGDFYWATSYENSFYLAACDSTGHGVPGAFMSLLNISFLNEAVNEKHISNPGEIFSFTREKLIQNISHDGRRDGMDGILICLENGKKKMKYASAYNAPVIIRNQEAISLEYDKMPVGKSDKSDNFKSFEFEFESGDMLYLFSDGYPDQFGGEKGKKLKVKNLIQFLISVSNESMASQKEKISTSFNNWKGDFEQIDDVLLIGIRIS